MTRSLFKKSTILYVFLFIALSCSSAVSAEKIKFGVPSWPGVTVKTEVVCQLLEEIGYETDQFIISPSIVFKSIQTGDINAYLGGWTPVENPMIDPLVKEGKIEKVQANVKTALSGLCVPDYVWDAGIHSIEDMTANPGKFGKNIYCIEAGSGISDNVEEAIENDAAGLGDWTLVNSSTSGMLSQAEALMEKKEWVVFFGWAPHWMNIKYDIKYLDQTPATEKIANFKSVVYTILPTDFSEKNPNIYKFFEQFVVPSKVQSYWILKHSFEENPSEEVAEEWIKKNKKLVSQWLENIETANGESAVKAVYN
jgi:glycine betaine/proline transport system substrate-binding protein